MVTETPNKDHLLPVKYPQLDLFICDIADAILKDILPQLEHPFYSLSKKPETKIRRYQHKGNWLEVIPSVKGLATIYDKDILIYCISQIMATLNDGVAVSKRVRINTRTLLQWTNRGTAGKDYQALSNALVRLAGTQISTNIRKGNEEIFSTFHLIESGTIKRRHGLDGRLVWCEVTLSDWVFDAIRADNVLTLHPDYFRLKKPIERRVYELARKHCGKQDQWGCSVSVLHKKSGSQSPLKHFRYLLKELVAHDHLPDYQVMFDEAADKVIFSNRGKWWDKTPTHGAKLPHFYPETYTKAKRAAPGYDVYMLYSLWCDWWMSKAAKPDNPEGAFIGFCRTKYRENPHP